MVSQPRLYPRDNKILHVQAAHERGKFADMVVLSADYLSVPEAEIKDIKPLKTIVNDKVVYDARS